MSFKDFSGSHGAEEAALAQHEGLRRQIGVMISMPLAEALSSEAVGSVVSIETWLRLQTSSGTHPVPHLTFLAGVLSVIA